MITERRRQHRGSRPATFVSCVLLGIIVLCVILPAIPPLHPVPYRDSGVFLFVGDRILEGAIPYQDVWDHKPPFVHFINAAGLLAGGGSAWGIWCLQVAALLAAAWTGFQSLSRFTSTQTAFLASVSWLSGVPFVLQMGNFTEVYAIPLQMATFAVFLRIGEDDEQRPMLFAALGVLGASLLLLRPNLAGLPLIAVTVGALTLAVQHHWRYLVRFLGCVLIGGAIVLVPVVIWFSIHHALADLVDAVLRYNIVYSSSTPAHQLAAFKMGVRLTVMPATALLAAGGWIVAVWRLGLSGGQISDLKRSFLWLVAAAFPIEYWLSSMTGREYPHYFLAVLPTCGVLVGLLIHHLGSQGSVHIRRASYILMVLVVAAGGFAATREISRQLLYSTVDLRAQQTVTFIEDHTNTDDLVLVWGAETTVNFLSGRRSPTRYVYQYPLFTRGFWREEMIEEMITDLEHDPPRLVIDTSSSNVIIPTLSLSVPLSGMVAAPGYEIPPSIDRIRSWIHNRYHPVAIIGGWRILEPNP